MELNYDAIALCLRQLAHVERFSASRVCRAWNIAVRII